MLFQTYYSIPAFDLKSRQQNVFTQTFGANICQRTRPARRTYFLNATVPPTLNGERAKFLHGIVAHNDSLRYSRGEGFDSSPARGRCILPLYWPNNPRYAVTLRIRQALTFSLGRHSAGSLSAACSRWVLSNGRLAKKEQVEILDAVFKLGCVHFQLKL